jgi:aldose 1-epimerase
LEQYQLIDSSSGHRAIVIPELGFNCCSWQIDWGQGLEEVLWTEQGFEQGEKRPSGSGIPLLFPHPGRIAGGRYVFDGTEYSLPLTDGHPNSLHGFVLNRPWHVVDATQQSIRGEFHASQVDARILDWWPSDFVVQVEYTLAGNQLTCDIEWTNAGEGPLPYGLGTHTYFRLPLATRSSADDVVLTAPIKKQWELVDMLATGRQLELDPRQTFSTGMSLAGQQFDSMFLLDDRVADISTSLTDPRSGRRIRQEFPRADFPHLVIYTPGHREAICMEPYSCAADPFRLEQLGVGSGLRVLAPGDSAKTRITLTAESV